MSPLRKEKKEKEKERKPVGGLREKQRDSKKKKRMQFFPYYINRPRKYNLIYNLPTQRL